MDVVRLDTSELQRYLNTYVVDGEFLRYGQQFRKKLSLESINYLDKLENGSNVAWIREELAAFDERFGEFTTMDDVIALHSRLVNNLWTLNSWDNKAYYPVNEFAKGIHDLYYLRILYYVITLTNRSLPSSEAEYRRIMPSYPDPNLTAYKNNMVVALTQAYPFFKSWPASCLYSDSYGRILYKSFQDAITQMAAEVGIDTRTQDEKRADQLTEAKDKGISFILKLVLAFLVALAMSFIFNGWEGTFH